MTETSTKLQDKKQTNTKHQITITKQGTGGTTLHFLACGKGLSPKGRDKIRWILALERVKGSAYS